MNLFKPKTIEQRIKQTWITKVCDLSRLKMVLEEEYLIEFWVKHNDTHFQIGSSSDGNRYHNFDKVYFINTNTKLSLFQLLNNKLLDEGFFMSETLQDVLNAKIVNGKSLEELWQDCIIVGIEQMDPKHYNRI